MSHRKCESSLESLASQRGAKHNPERQNQFWDCHQVGSKVERGTDLVGEPQMLVLDPGQELDERVSTRQSDESRELTHRHPTTPESDDVNRIPDLGCRSVPFERDGLSRKKH